MTTGILPKEDHLLSFGHHFEMGRGDQSSKSSDLSPPDPGFSISATVIADPSFLINHSFRCGLG